MICTADKMITMFLFHRLWISYKLITTKFLLPKCYLCTKHHKLNSRKNFSTRTHHPWIAVWDFTMYLYIIALWSAISKKRIYSISICQAEVFSNLMFSRCILVFFNFFLMPFLAITKESNDTDNWLWKIHKYYFFF